MKNILIVLFGASLFGLVALFRGISLGQEIETFYLVVLLVLSFIFGVWLFFINRSQEKEVDNEK